MSDLAVVIPAIRARFLRAALASLAAQSDTHFVVVVGDDASPDDLGKICAEFAHCLDLRYHRFNANLGAADLVAQWTRTLELCENEWIWMIGDDDELEPGCVEAFREARKCDAQATLFHFGVRRIDAEGRVLATETSFPPRLSARSFLLGRLSMSLASYAPDYVFSRAAFRRSGGFPSVPLAWCADDAMWIQLAGKHGIVSIDGPRVRWRMSGSNLSSPNLAHAAAKVEAHTRFLEWIAATLPWLPKQPGDPDDGAIRKIAAWWYYQQAEHTGFRFSPANAWSLGRRLARAGFCKLPEALARAARARWNMRLLP